MNSIKKAIELKKKLDAMRPLNRDDEQRIMQKFRLDWNYHSNHIEGNTLTYGETKALLFFGITAQGKPLKDHIEITGHNEAIKTIIEVLEEKRPLTERFIREIHTLLLKEPYESYALTPDGQPTKKKINVGEYKSSPNHVETATGEIFRFATPEETPSMMHDLIEWYRKTEEESDVNPVLLAAEFHYKFIRIHPFDDGNGRTARILMNFILMKFGYPPTIIKVEDKENYFSALRQADAGILEPFVDYIAENLVNSLELMIRGAKGENIEEPDDIDKEMALLDQQLNSISTTIEKGKSQKSLLSVFDDSISKLAVSLFRKHKLFEKYYSEVTHEIYIDNESLFVDEKMPFAETRKSISERVSLIQILTRFNTFNRAEFQEFNHKSEITFKFYKTRYTVGISKDKDEFTKFYNQQLSAQEITRLVNRETRTHKELIEKKIQELENN